MVGFFFFFCTHNQTHIHTFTLSLMSCSPSSNRGTISFFPSLSVDLSFLPPFLPSFFASLHLTAHPFSFSVPSSMCPFFLLCFLCFLLASSLLPLHCIFPPFLASLCCPFFSSSLPFFLALTLHSFLPSLHFPFLSYFLASLLSSSLHSLC